MPGPRSGYRNAEISLSKKQQQQFWLNSPVSADVFTTNGAHNLAGCPSGESCDGRKCRLITGKTDRRRVTKSTR